MKKDIAILYNSERDGRTYKGFNSSIYTTHFSGVKNLLQKITKLLLTPIGSDMYNPGAGSSIPNFLSRGPSNIDVPTLESEVISSIGQIENVIKYDQAIDTTLNDSERLKSINLESVAIQNGGKEIYITLLITTMENFTYIVRI